MSTLAPDCVRGRFHVRHTSARALRFLLLWFLPGGLLGCERENGGTERSGTINCLDRSLM